MNELDKLRYMLMRSKIPFESYQEKFDELYFEKWYRKIAKVPEQKYSRNQIIYGRIEDGEYWKFDAICQKGSYGVEQGLTECYGSLVEDEYGSPITMTAEEAYRIIEKDWRESNV